MFDARQTKKEIIDGGMKLHALYVDKCAEIERLQAALKDALGQMHNDLEYGDEVEKNMRRAAINCCSNTLKE